MYENYYPDYLCHHGTKGMKWGVRRYQNKDGSLTSAGKKRLSGGKVYKITDKQPYTDGTTGYVSVVGTRKAKNGGNFAGDYALGATRKEAIRNAEAKFIKDLNKTNDDHYESRSTQRLRNKIQKEAYAELKKYDSKGIDRGEAVNSKSKYLVDTINEGKRYIEKISITNDKLSKVYDVEYKKAYDKLANDYEKQHGRKLDRYSDEHDEIYELASAKAYKSESVTKIRDEGDRVMKNYKKYVDKAANDTLGKHKDTVVRERGGREITATQALDDIIRSAAADDRRNKFLKERGLL